MEKDIILTENAPAPIGPYSQAVVVSGKLIFTAGQIAIDPRTGELIQGDIELQMHVVLKNIRAILEAKGTGLKNVVKTTVFMKDLADFGKMNEVYAEYFPESPPARSAVEVARLPKDVKVEIEAIAVI